jgi:hypothetical protein
MRVVFAEPPLIDEIDRAFNVRGKPVIFCWGDIIYNPQQVTITRELAAHEAVHCRRQLGVLEPGTEPAELAIRAWWGRYIRDPNFRLLEEIPAHVEEFLSLCEQHAPRWPNRRAMRRTFAAAIAKRLSSPLYGGLISFAEAKRSLMAGAG